MLCQWRGGVAPQNIENGARAQQVVDTPQAVPRPLRKLTLGGASCVCLAKVCRLHASIFSPDDGDGTETELQKHGECYAQIAQPCVPRTNEIWKLW